MELLDKCGKRVWRRNVDGSDSRSAAIGVSSENAFAATT